MPSWSEKNLGNNSNARVRTGKFYYGWVVLAACFIILIIATGTQYSFGVFFKSLAMDFDLTRALTSEIFSVYMVISILFSILGGWALDRYGPKAVFVVMGLFTGLSLFLTSKGHTLWHLFISYSLLLAIGTGPAYPTSMSLVSRWFTKRRGLAVGIVSSGSGIGIVVMSPIAAWLITSFGWQNSYLIMALIALFVMVPSALLLKRAPGEVAVSPEVERIDTDTTNSFEKQFPNQLGGLSLPQAVKTTNFWLMIIIYFLLAFCVYIVITHIVPHAIDLSINPVQAASILSLIGGTSILGRLLMGTASDSIGRKQIIMICALLMAGTMLWLIQSSELWMLYLFAAVFGFSYGGGDAPLIAIIGDIFGERHLGVIMPVTSVGWPIGAAVGSALAGYIFDINGSYTFAFIIGMIAILTAAALILFMRTPTAKTGAEAIW